MEKDNKNVFKYFIAILIFIVLIFAIIRFTSVNNVNNEVNTGALFNFKTTKPVVKKQWTRDWEEIPLEEEFNATYGECAEPMKSFIRENNFVIVNNNEPTEYEQYSHEEIVKYKEENNLNEKFNEEDFIVSRESTDGKLIPGDIKVYTLSSWVDVPWWQHKKCENFEWTKKNGVTIPYHQGWLAPHVRWDDL